MLVANCEGLTLLHTFDPSGVISGGHVVRGEPGPSGPGYLGVAHSGPWCVRGYDIATEGRLPFDFAQARLFWALGGGID